MTKVVVCYKYIRKLVLQDLKRKWNKQNREHGFEERFEPRDYDINLIQVRR